MMLLYFCICYFWSYNEFVVGNEAIQRLQITPKQVVLHFPSFYGFEKEEMAVKSVRDNSVCEVIRDDDATIQVSIFYFFYSSGLL